MLPFQKTRVFFLGRVKLRVPSRSPGGCHHFVYGGGPLVRLPLSIAYDLAVRAVYAPTWCLFPWVSLLVVASLALELEVVRVQTDLWVVAVDVVEPGSPVVDYLARLYAAGLAESSVDCRPSRYVCVTRTSPCLRLVELFLIQCVHTSGFVPSTHRSDVSYAGHY